VCVEEGLSFVLEIHGCLWEAFLLCRESEAAAETIEKREAEEREFWALSL